jgi:putative membrane protein
MIVRPLTDLVRLLPLLAGLLILHTKSGAGLAWGAAAAVLAIVTGLVHWATTRYLITDERVYLRRGLLNQKTLSVARDRIRTVDVTAHLLHRVLGVCRVSIGTGRNDLRSGESFHLDGVTRAEAESLRIVLLSGVKRPAPAGQPVPAGQSAPAGQPAAARQPSAADSTRPASTQDESTDIVRLNLSWVRFAPLTMTGLVVLGVLFGGVIQVTNATDINLAATDPVRHVVAAFTALSVGQRVLAGGAVALAGYVLVAMAGYVAVFWNFRLAGVGTDTLRVTRGLFSLRATTISLSRLRGVEISEPLLLRAARGARCIAIATGLHIGRGAEREGSVLSPPAPRAVAEQVASSLLGLGADLYSGPLERHGPAARRRRFTRALAGAAALVAAIYLATWAQHGPDWAWLASFALLPAAALLAADRYRSLGHRLGGGWLVTRVGSLVRRRSIISTDAIIGWRIHQTWFQRRQGLMTLTATTAAGQQHYSVRDVPVADGLALAAAATGDLLVPFLRSAPVRELSRPGFHNRTPGWLPWPVPSEWSGETLIRRLIGFADGDDVVRTEGKRSGGRGIPLPGPISWCVLSRRLPG